MQRLRILVVADAKIPVPPERYGGAERMLGHLCKAFETSGHDVTLVAAAGSTAVQHVYSYPWAGQRALPWRAYARSAFLCAIERALARGQDVMLSNARIDYVAPILRRGLPTIYHFPNPILDSEVRALNASKKGPLALVATSRSHLDGRTSKLWHVIFNGVDTRLLSFTAAGSQTYLAFLGRLTRNKGVDIAIRVARAAGLPLRVAGNISDGPDDGGYFAREVAPHIGHGVEWVGEIDDAQKVSFLGRALALLMPVRWAEPFGIVVAEALSCGTPVIAAPCGSMPELVRHGVNGFLAGTEAEMLSAVGRIPEIDRVDCRTDALTRFSKSVMAARYLALIDEVARQGAFSGTSRTDAKV